MSYEEDYDDAPQAGPDSVTISETAIRWNAQQMFDSIVRTAAASIVKGIEADLKVAVAASVKSQIDEQVGAKVAAILDTNIQPTNEWGEAKGEALSLREMVGRTARDYLGVKVNKEGVASTYHADRTRLEHIVSKQVAETFNYTMQAEVKKAVEQARTEAVARVGAVVGDMIVKLGK